MNDISKSLKDSKRASISYSIGAAAFAAVTAYLYSTHENTNLPLTQDNPEIVEYTQICLIKNAEKAVTTNTDNVLASGHIQINRDWINACVQEEHASRPSRNQQNLNIVFLHSAMATVIFSMFAFFAFQDKRRSQNTFNQPKADIA